MQSTRPMPGNQWPHEMRITVEHDSERLMELLWIREAWGLQPVGPDLPPLLSDPPTGVSVPLLSRDRAASLRAAWPRIWDACVQHAGLILDPTLFERLRESAVGSPERGHLQVELNGPSWRDEFGNEVFTAQYSAWTEARVEAHSRRLHRSWDESPERVSLDALVSAWRAGLTKVVTIPCQGSYTRIIGAHTLLMTAGTSSDSRTYRAALAQFR
jgi:hypothetical protein